MREGRADAWVAALRTGMTTGMPASELYVGCHWSIVRHLPELARARGWSEATLWVASAGYGLVRGDAVLVPYSATFAPGHADSIVQDSNPDSITEQQAAWFTRLNQLFRRSRSSNGSPFARPDDSILVVGSRHYTAALAPALLEWSGRSEAPERLVIVTTRLGEPALASSAIEITADLQLPVGGPLVSLHARAASALVSEVRPAAFTAPRIVAHANSEWGRRHLQAIQRPRLTDDDILKFISKQMRSEQSASASALLRRLRDGGLACEQHRFGRLYRTLVGTA